MGSYGMGRALGVPGRAVRRRWWRWRWYGTRRRPRPRPWPEDRHESARYGTTPAAAAAAGGGCSRLFQCRCLWCRWYAHGSFHGRRWGYGWNAVLHPVAGRGIRCRCRWLRGRWAGVRGVRRWRRCRWILWVRDVSWSQRRYDWRRRSRWRCPHLGTHGRHPRCSRPRPCPRGRRLRGRCPWRELGRWGRPRWLEPVSVTSDWGHTAGVQSAMVMKMKMKTVRAQPGDGEMGPGDER